MLVDREDREATARRARKAAMATLAQRRRRRARAAHGTRPACRARPTAARPRDRPGHRARPHRRRRRAFNLGEATVTRATVRLRPARSATPTRSAATSEKARLAAIADALWQDPARRAAVEAKVAGAAARSACRGRRQAPRRDGGDARSISSPWCAERTDGRSAETIDGGFADPVFDAQAVFRAVMDAMARPGTISRSRPLAAPPAPLSPTAAAVALTLCDHDTPLWLDPALAALGGGAHPGSASTPARRSPTTPAEALSPWSPSPAEPDRARRFAQGTQEYPDRSTTLILQVETCRRAQRCRCEGPGIETTRRHRAGAAAAPFRRAVEAEPRALPARRRPHPGRGRRRRLPAAHHAHPHDGGLSHVCRGQGRRGRHRQRPPAARRPPPRRPLACRRSASTRSSSSWRSPSTA